MFKKLALMTLIAFSATPAQADLLSISWIIVKYGAAIAQAIIVKAAEAVLTK